MERMHPEHMLEAYCLVSSKLSAGIGPRVKRIPGPWERPKASPTDVCMEALGALRGEPLNDVEKKAAAAIILREGGAVAFMDRMRRTLEEGMSGAFEAESLRNPMMYGNGGYASRVENTMRAANRGVSGSGMNPAFETSELSGFLAETRRAGEEARMREIQAAEARMAENNAREARNRHEREEAAASERSRQAAADMRAADNRVQAEKRENNGFVGALALAAPAAILMGPVAGVVAAGFALHALGKNGAGARVVEGVGVAASLATRAGVAVAGIAFTGLKKIGDRLAEMQSEKQVALASGGPAHKGPGL